MKTQDVIWTALPNGRKSAKTLQLSVFISPRLQTDEGLPIPRLSQFADFLDWPSAKIKYQVFIGGFGPFAAKDVTKPNGDSKLYGGVFNANTYVRPHQFPTALASTVRIRSYPVRHIHQFVRDIYSKFVSSSPNEFPPFGQLNANDAFGAIGFVGRDQTEGDREQRLADQLEAVLERNQVIDFAPLNPNDPDFYAKAFLQAKRFHQPRSGVSESATDLVDLKKPTLAAAGAGKAIDFHQMLTMAAEHPDLLRSLGLVVDLEFDPTGVPFGDTTVRVVPVWTPQLAATQNSSPQTRCRLTSSGFVALPRSVSPELADGALPFDDAARYELLEVDHDGAALKSMHFANNLGRSHLPEHQTTDTPNAYAPPALRSIGLSVARVGMARTLLDNIKRSDSLNTNFKAGVVLDAEDVTRGYAVHVWESLSGKWRSLLRRTGTYDFVDIKKSVKVEDEGAVSLGPTSDPLGAVPEDLYQQENLFLWSGWSLAAQRPGNTLVTDPAHDPNGPMQRVDSTADADFRVQIRYKVTPGTLPRLRFGADYRVRARAVDLAGNRMPFGDPTAVDPHATTPVSYGRFEPVESPVMLLRSKRTPGESVEKVVIRSNYNTPPPVTATTERHVSPSKVAEMVAEEHGLFDTPDVIDHGAFSVIAAMDDKTYANSPQASTDPTDYPDVQFFDVNKLTLPYFPDPIGRGASLRGLPGLPPASIVKMPFVPPAPGKWPAYLPFRFILGEGSGLPVRDVANGTLSVQLPKAEVTTLRLSTYLDAADLPLMGVWHWLPVATQVALLPLAVDGQIWALTPWRDVTLIHAVRQPLLNPRFIALPGPFRDTIGQTIAFFTQAPMEVSRKSTGTLKVFADWTEAIDAGPGASVDPSHEPKSAVAFQVDLADPIFLSPDSLLLQDERQEFHDTKYRRVTYRAVAASKFIEYFRQVSTVALTGTSAVVVSLIGFVPETMKVTSLDRATTYIRNKDYVAVDGAGTLARTATSTIPSGGQVLADYTAPPVERPGPGELPIVTTVDVPNSARPDAPNVLYIVPTWKRDVASPVSGAVISTRQGGGLRVYLDRPWWSSGDGELLGVLLWPGTFGGPPAPPDSLKPYVSRWGIDPIHTSQSTTLFPTLDRFPRHVAQSATPLSLQELHDQPAVLVSGHAVGFDADRKLWYCDIEVDPGPAYFPFVRLALARYQPISLTNAQLSRAVLADFIQTAPDRTFTVVRTDDPLLLLLTAVGISYASSRNADGTIRSGPAVMRVQLEQRSHLLAGDFGWQAVGSPVELSPSPGNGPETIWTGRLLLPPGNWPKRLIVEEVERLSADGTFGPTATHERLVYTDIVPLSPDRFGVLTPSPAAADFGSVTPNGGTADRTISVANTGTAPLQIGAVSLMGTDAAQFSILNDGASGQTLNIGDARSVTVRFAPTAFGSFQAQLDFPNDALPAPLDVDLTGSGVGPKLDVTPAGVVNFGPRLINTTSPAIALTLTNTGNANLVLGTLAIGGPDASSFAIVSDPSGQTLAPGANTHCDLTFTPANTGPKSADLSIPSNAPGSPQLVPLAGQGIVT